MSDEKKKSKDFWHFEHVKQNAEYANEAFHSTLSILVKRTPTQSIQCPKYLSVRNDHTIIRLLICKYSSKSSRMDIWGNERIQISNSTKILLYPKSMKKLYWKGDLAVCLQKVGWKWLGMEHMQPAALPWTGLLTSDTLCHSMWQMRALKTYFTRL
jgi:hypothetical protein